MLVLLLSACESAPAPTPTSPPATSTATTVPTATPTPLPPILRQSLTIYEAPHGAFSLQVPASWQVSDIPGGIRFRQSDDSPTSITVQFQPLPATVDADAYLSSVISTTDAAVQLNDANTFQLLDDETLLDGHRRLELIGQIDPEAPLAHLLAEFWVDSKILLGFSLTAPASDWPEVEPLWPLVQQSFVTGDLSTAATAAPLGLLYIHPSQTFTMTVPAGWGIVEEDDQGVLLGDLAGFAQYAVDAMAFDHTPTAKELDDAITGLLGTLPEQLGYEELDRQSPTSRERLLQFQVLSPEEGLYRTELRAVANGNLLLTTSFSAPPHDWELYEPSYDLMRGTLQIRPAPTPDEATQDADPLAGLIVGDVRFYRAGGGALWVSAPIYNYRTRNLADLTAAVQLFDNDGQLVGAESWRLPQRIVPAGGTTYLTQRITPDVAPLDGVVSAAIKLVDATDTDKPAPIAWAYERGSAERDQDGNVVLKVSLGNPSDEVRRYIYVVGIVYDADGNLIFAKGETQTLPYATPSGQDVDLKIVIWGPLPDLASFDVVGEVPQ